MKYIILFILFLINVHAIAREYSGDGAWAIYNYNKDTTLITSLHIYRGNQDNGAKPTFMLNHDQKKCTISFGLIFFTYNISDEQSKRDIFNALDFSIKQADFFADDEMVSKNSNDVQTLNLGGMIYSRRIISSDVLAAFMLAKNGQISIHGQDSSIAFNMNGLYKTMNNLIKKYCS